MLALMLALANAQPDAVVYGYLAYWADDLESLRWDALTHVAIFNVGIESDGSLSSTSNWTSRVDEAMSYAELHDVKIDLCVTNFSSSSIDSFLSSPSKRASAVSELGDLVNDHGANGVNVDFEGMSSDNKQDLVDFIEELKQVVDEVTLATPAVDWSGAYDYDALANASDGLFIMGYGYHWSGGDPGPVAPLYGGGIWSDYSLDWTVEDYVYYGAPRDKIILGLPLYGRNWPTTNNDVPGDATADSSAVVMSSAIPECEAAGRYYDEQTETPYCFPSSTEQLWYDDVGSIAAKVDYAVNDAGLLGTGVWALHYEGDYDELWDEVLDLTVDLSGGDGGDGGDDGGDGGDGGDEEEYPENDGSSALAVSAGESVLAYVEQEVLLVGDAEEGEHWSWSQVAGPSVALDGDRSRTSSFVAEEGGTYTFQLDVEASDGRRGSDQVDVQVLDKAGCATGAPAGAWWLALPFLLIYRRSPES